MARLKIEKTDEYEIRDIYKEFVVTIGKQEFRILRKNRTIRVLRKIEREGETPTYIELKSREIGDLMRRLKPSNLGRRVSSPSFPHPPFSRPPFSHPRFNTPTIPYIWVGPNSPEDDIEDSGFDDESTRVLYEDEYDELFEGLDDTDYE